MERLPREDLEKIVDELFAWSDKIAHDAMRRAVDSIRGELDKE